MSRILTSVAVDATPAIVSTPSHVLDDATRALLEREVASARQQGHREGHAAAMEAARAEAAVVADAVDRAAARITVILQQQHAALAEALAARVMDATVAVLGREPDDAGRALVERLTAAVARIDDVALVVRVADQRRVVAAEALAGRAGVTVEVDDTLGPDDALVTGEFSHVDLRVARLLEALDELLVDHTPLGPLARPVDELGHDGGVTS